MKSIKHCFLFYPHCRAWVHHKSQLNNKQDLLLSARDYYTTDSYNVKDWGGQWRDTRGGGDCYSGPLMSCFLACWNSASDNAPCFHKAVRRSSSPEYPGPAPTAW